MKWFVGIFPFFFSLLWAQSAVSQSDLAMYDVFSKYRKAVYSISIEIPEEVIQQHYQESLRSLREIEESNKDIFNFNLLEHMINQHERNLQKVKEQLLSHNPVLGIGFAIDPHHVVTVSTVIRNVSGGVFHLHDDHKKKVAEARLLNIDPLTGVAVLRVYDATFHNFINLNDTSTTLPEAYFVMSIQKPYELPASPVSGMIQGFYRMMGIFQVERYIQAQMLLYPGNEGAPVFSTSSQFIGMIATEYRKGNFPGVTFIMPGDMVAESAQDIVQNGKRIRGWIPGLKSIGPPDPRGIIVTGLVPESPAAQSLHEGDIIVELDGVQQNDGNGIYFKIFSMKPNQNIHIKVFRGQQLLPFDIMTGALKD